MLSDKFLRFQSYRIFLRFLDFGESLKKFFRHKNCFRDQRKIEPKNYFALRSNVLSFFNDRRDLVTRQCTSTYYIDSYSKWIRQNCYKFFIKEKLKENILFSYLHFIQLCTSWNHQRILKIWQLVSLRCQNSLRSSTPEKMHFQEGHFLFSPILPV